MCWRIAGWPPLRIMCPRLCKVFHALFEALGFEKFGATPGGNVAGQPHLCNFIGSQEGALKNTPSEPTFKSI